MPPWVWPLPGASAGLALPLLEWTNALRVCIVSWALQMTENQYEWDSRAALL
jgi:hypothetical protein